MENLFWNRDRISSLFRLKLYQKTALFDEIKRFLLKLQPEFEIEKFRFQIQVYVKTSINRGDSLPVKTDLRPRRKNALQRDTKIQSQIKLHIIMRETAAGHSQRKRRHLPG